MPSKTNNICELEQKTREMHTSSLSDKTWTYNPSIRPRETYMGLSKKPWHGQKARKTRPEKDRSATQKLMA